MKILAIDPGNVRSAWLVYDSDDGRVLDYGIDDNKVMKSVRYMLFQGLDALAIEMIASFGMPVGREVFDTCVWIGRFIGMWEEYHTGRFHLVYRKDIKFHLCGSSRAKDPNVRQALLDRFGPGRELAQGTKKKPGPLYGISKDLWSALAVAVTFSDLHVGDSREAVAVAGGEGGMV